jgi:uncharacterized membrane protein
MTNGRMEAFTDGVVAIVITIMVLEMKVPPGPNLKDLLSETPVFLAYALSFVNIGLIWNNHHHVMHASEHVDGRVLWANLLLLFWITLIPFVVRWIDETHVAPLPTAAYGVVMFLMGLAYQLFERTLIAVNGAQSKLAEAVGAEWKEFGSMTGYAIATALAFVSPYASVAIYVVIAAAWFVPDRRIESRLKA